MSKKKPFPIIENYKVIAIFWEYTEYTYTK